MSTTYYTEECPCKGCTERQMKCHGSCENTQRGKRLSYEWWTMTATDNSDVNWRLFGRT